MLSTHGTVGAAWEGLLISFWGCMEHLGAPTGAWRVRGTDRGGGRGVQRVLSTHGVLGVLDHPGGVPKKGGSDPRRAIERRAVP